MDDIISKDTVYNIFNAPKGKSSPHGEEIYEWEYLDENGKLMKDSKNVKEEINSFLPMVDYKKQIERGELELDGNSLDLVSKDYRGLPDNTVDYYKFLSGLAAIPKEQVAKLMESVNQGTENNIQEKQATDKASASRTKIDNKINGDKSEDSASVTDINVKGGTE